MWCLTPTHTYPTQKEPLMAIQVITTLTVKKGASAASVSLKRNGDGSFEFTDANGKEHRREYDPFVKELFDEIDSLV